MISSGCNCKVCLSFVVLLVPVLGILLIIDLTLFSEVRVGRNFVTYIYGPACIYGMRNEVSICHVTIIVALCVYKSTPTTCEVLTCKTPIII